jgi:flagellar protein FliJ
MKSMKTLIRVKQRQLDELKRAISTLEAKREEIYQTISELSERLQKELKAAENLPDLAHFFGDFSRHIRSRQDQLYVMARRTEIEIEKMTLVIRELFNEMKKYEVAHANWEKKNQEMVRKREEKQLDETAIGIFLRQEHPV